MRLPRLSTRRWVMLVVLVAVTMGAAEHLRRLRIVYREQVARHRALETSSRRIAGYATGLQRLGLEPRARPGPGRRTEYHAAMRRKYERAARYPWLPVPPDPPPP